MMETAMLCSTKEVGVSDPIWTLWWTKTDVKHLQESFDHVTVRGGDHHFYSSGNKVLETSCIKGTLSSYPCFLPVDRRRTSVQNGHL